MRSFLDFEQPIAELESKIEELRHLPGAADINIADEVAKLQGKAERLLRQTYSRLTAWQKVQVARHPERPHLSDYLAGLVTDFTPWRATAPSPRTGRSSAGSGASAASR